MVPQAVQATSNLEHRINDAGVHTVRSIGMKDLLFGKQQGWHWACHVHASHLLVTIQVVGRLLGMS
jgi:hypothetical protein